jgi:NADH-quinone oxidoreductase subunit J
MEHLSAFLFWTIGSLTALCAIAVVVTQNIVRSATWLLFTLAGVAGLFFLLGADLVGAIQILVYVGGTLILVVFGVMLTAQGPFISMRTGAAEWAISAVAGFALFGVLAVTAMNFRDEKPAPPEDSVAARYAPTKPLVEVPVTKADASQPEAQRSQYSMIIGEGLLGVGVGPAHEEEVYPKNAEDPRKEGRILRTSYLFPFEIVSVHLLVVLIGAAYLARAKRRKREE